MRAFLKHLWGEAQLAGLGFLLAICLITPLVAIVLMVAGCNSISSIGATGSYNGDMWTVGVTITFKGDPSAETVAALEAAHAVRLKASPQVWALGRYRSGSNVEGRALEAAIADGATVEKIE